jgi:hypothetical protein
MDLHSRHPVPAVELLVDPPLDRHRIVLFATVVDAAVRTILYERVTRMVTVLRNLRTRAAEGRR